jgi:hypothetical protein
VNVRGVVRLAIASGVARIVVAVLWGPSFSNDADRYTQLDGGGVAIDWTGSLGSPAPLTQIVWHLPHDLAITVQGTVAGAAWGLLAVVIANFADRWRWASLVAFLTIGVTWTPMLLTFDAMPLTDSLALAGASLVLAVTIDRVVARQPVMTQTAGEVLAVSGLLMSIASRPVNVIALAPLAFMTVVWCSRGLARRRLLAAGALSIVSLYAVGLTANSETGTNEENRAQNRLAMRASAAYLAAATDMGMPECSSLSHDDLIRGAEASYTSIGIGPIRQQLILPGDQDARDDALRAVKKADCPELHLWTASGGFDTLGPVWRAPVSHIRLFLLDQVGLFTPYSHDERVPIGLRLVDPVIWLSASLVAAGVALRRWFARLRGHQSRLGWGRPEAVIGGVTAFSWLLHQIVNWLADPLDMARHFLPVTTMLPFLLITLTLGSGRDSEHTEIA